MLYQAPAKTDDVQTTLCTNYFALYYFLIFRREILLMGLQQQVISKNALAQNSGHEMVHNRYCKQMNRHYPRQPTAETDTAESTQLYYLEAAGLTNRTYKNFTLLSQQQFKADSYTTTVNRKSEINNQKRVHLTEILLKRPPLPSIIFVLKFSTLAIFFQLQALPFQHQIPRIFLAKNSPAQNQPGIQPQNTGTVLAKKVLLKINLGLC
eukprot:TRINITY_DN8632_c0_g2_i2.p3 TRINITY_DN8632_c0_g2~~TRINITY_DN8632_c0_g2_i2.p3  ORF type:complete len:209 (-),score=3.95 TRINITY_DN8632_c0_g2_i2:13-639(-)